MRRRAFWIALPIAIVFALWAGPGLATVGDDAPVPAPTIDPAPAGGVAPPEPAAADEPECEGPHDPGPDGDR